MDLSLLASFASFSELGLIFDLGIIVVFATILAAIGRLFRQPMILAYILAGVLIGPIGLNLITHTEIPLISELGIAFLLFTVGVETDFSKLKSIGKVVLIGGIIQVLFMLGFIFGFLYLLGFDPFLSVYLGLILAFSSTTVVIKLLSDSHQINTLHGRLMVGFLLVQDFIVILALPALQNLSHILSFSFLGLIALKGIALFVLALLLGKYVFPRFMHYTAKNEELMFLSGVSICFAFIFVAFYLDLSPAIGAFLAGLSLSTLAYNMEISSKIHGLRDFFVTVFFVSLGMQIMLTFSSASLGLMALLFFMLLMVFALKPLLFFLVNLFSGFGSRTALIVGLGLAQVSEFSFILAAQGCAFSATAKSCTGIIPTEIYSTVILVTAISMTVTPYFMHRSGQIHAFLSKPFQHVGKKFGFKKKIEELENLPSQNLTDHIVLIGAGVVGKGIISCLKHSYRIVVVDNDPEIIQREIREGNHAVYGNIDNDEIWSKVKLKECSMLISTMPFVRDTLQVIRKAREINPDIRIFARAKFKQDALQLYKEKVDFVILPEVIGSNVFIKQIAKFLESGKLYKISNLEDEYIHYLTEETKKKHKGFKL